MVIPKFFDCKMFSWMYIYNLTVDTSGAIAEWEVARPKGGGIFYIQG